MLQALAGMALGLADQYIHKDTKLPISRPRLIPTKPRTYQKEILGNALLTSVYCYQIEPLAHQVATGQ